MKKFFLILCLFLTGCAHQLDLISRNNSGNGTGNAQEMGKQISIYLNNKFYKGTYVHDGMKVINSTARTTTTGTSNGTVVNGKRMATVYGTSSGTSTGYATTYIPGSGNGSVIATSGDDTLRCDFNYSGGTGIGYCVNNTGNEYDLIIH